MHWRDTSSVNANWARTHETPEWIAERATVATDLLGRAFGISSWSPPYGPAWTADLDKPAYLRKIAKEENGEHWETGGFGAGIWGGNKDIRVGHIFEAGAAYLSWRLPPSDASLTLRAKRPGAVTEAHANAALAALVEAWNPLVVDHGSLEVKRLARRGGWQTPSAQRLWLNDEVSPIHTIPDGITATRLGPGTLLTMPDDTPAADVVTAMAAFRDANNLDTYYDAPAPPPPGPPLDFGQPARG